MTALPLAPSANAVRDAMQRLGAIQPGPYRVVSCYLKLEPRDKTRGKYLIKMKNRIREAVAALERQSLERAVRDQVAADLERIRRYFEEPGELPRTRGVALFACRTIGLFDVIPLPHVYHSRLAVEPVPLVRELVALEQEFGTILVAACEPRRRGPVSSTASGRRSGAECSRAATASTTIICGSARRSTGTTPTSPTASTRSTPSGRWPVSSSRASAWTQPPSCRTSTRTSTTCCSA